MKKRTPSNPDHLYPLRIMRLREVCGGDDPDLVVVPDPGPKDTGPK